MKKIDVKIYYPSEKGNSKSLQVCYRQDLLDSIET
jgi:hypothetical protein